MHSHMILKEAMAFQEAHPGMRLASRWIDGERASLAGRICLVAGATVVPTGTDDDTGRLVTYEGRRHEVPQLARDLTGLVNSEANWLFHWIRTGDEQRIAIDALLEDRAIPGRPYWTYRDCHHRWISTGGFVQAAQMRRSVYLLEHTGWQAYDCKSTPSAHQWAANQARAMGALTYHTPQTLSSRKVML